MILTYLIEVEIDSSYTDTLGSIEQKEDWFDKEVINVNNGVYLYSLDVGDYIGRVTKISEVNKEKSND